MPGLADEQGALREAMQSPMSGPPLAELLRGGQRAVLVFPDATRAMPTERVVPAILAELDAAGYGPERVVLLSATGTHRANTSRDLERMLGCAIVERYSIVNHDARDARSLVPIGTTSQGAPALLSRVYLDAGARPREG